jgi:hypothetical protein
MKEIFFSIIIAINIVSIYFISSTLFSYWKYLMPKRKYSYLVLLAFLVFFMLYLILELKKYFQN